MDRLLGLAAATLIVGSVGAAPVAVDQSEIMKVGLVISRSKLTQETYAIYYWNRISRPNQPSREDWSAEFNSGRLHRVETSGDRIIADCAKPDGTHLSLAMDRITTGPRVAGVACGINTNLPFLKAESLGRVKSVFGNADRVRVTDAENIRTYDVSDQGIILRTLFQTNDARHLTVLEVEPISVSHKLPSSRMFSESSLSESFVPDEFKQAPRQKHP